MPDPTCSLVCTTIFEAGMLDDYHRNFRQFGHLDRVDVIVIPDRKTPSGTFERCRSLAGAGLRIVCPSLHEQESFLRRIGLDPALIPYNSDNRRNVGYLMALESGTRFTISIDDDNYCTGEEDFFLHHSVVAQQAGVHHQLSSSTGFFNICEFLEFERPAPVYARGFPYFARHRTETIEYTQSEAPVHVNAGLWTLDPDVDAITWLVAMPKVKSFTGQSAVLAAATWSPINTQNTSLCRDALPAYYFVKMGFPLAGLPIDRYGDIFSGYFVEACVKHLGATVRVGSPAAEHRRNRHDYLKDAAGELACILLLEDVIAWLRDVRLCGSTYLEAYESLSFAIEDAVERFQGSIWSDVSRAYFHQVAYYMRAWLKACRIVS
jgi:hypothetical protein